MIPLSEKLRPKIISEIVGQDKVLAFIHASIRARRPLSFLMYGPPGCGKTTIARVYSQAFQIPLVNLSGVLNSTVELKKILKEAQETPLFSRQILLFVDEIHRFNRAQQDIFLPFLEDGSLILIGATTENPSFSLNSALLSRMRVFTLESLNRSALNEIIDRYESVKGSSSIDKETRNSLIDLCGGDGRHLMNMLENLEVGLPIQQRPPLYDRHQNWHFNLISALHKSIRGSDPDAALYWFARMIEGGEDPLYIGRRLIRMASEDIGLADPEALDRVLSSFNAFNILGSPEGVLSLAQAVLYLALAPKSNATYNGYRAAQSEANKTGQIAPPDHILSNPKDYIYDPDTPHGFSGQNYFPNEFERISFYQPVERGFERELKKRVEYFSKLRVHLHQSIH